jgi:hypothetical protein
MMHSRRSDDGIRFVQGNALNNVEVSMPAKILPETSEVLS